MTYVARVLAIAAEAASADGADPLDEATRLALRRPEDFPTWDAEDGFALAVGADLSLVVRPSARRHGLGSRLLAEALAGLPGELRAWSHCDHPAAERLAARHGFTRVRELWVMRRPADQPLPAVPAPGGLTIRSFRAGDESELLRVNAAAFAAHPEQGAMDSTNLAVRMAEPWFDPAGLLVADAGDRLAGFHWTKQHSPELGEVYVVGIDPDAQGGGLGKALTVAGLRHLGQRGVREVLLYVESDNAAALAVYSRLGFTHAPEDTHVMYRRDGSG